MNEPRRIYTRIVIDMTQDDLPTIESESYLYDGPMALCVDGRGDKGNNDGRGDSESGRGSDGRGGGSSGGGGKSEGGYGGLGIGNPGSYGGKNDPGRTSEGGYSKGGGGDSGFGGIAGAAKSANVGIGFNSVADAIASHASRPGKSNTGYHGNDPDMTGQVSSLTGKQVSRTTQGYVTEDGTRMAYSSGNPTSYGAHATAREHDLGMSWDGGKAMSSAAQDSRHEARMARAREKQAAAAARTKDPVALGVDPHIAKAAYDDVMHGKYDKAVAIGAMTAQDAREVQAAFGGLSGAFGFGLDDVTTDYEANVAAVEQGLVDPTTGKLTAKGWANVASPVVGMLAGPLASMGFSLAGIPGAIAGALAPAAVNAYASPKKSKGIDAATGLASKVTGVDMSPFGAGLAYANTMNTMGKAQSYAGTSPGRPDSMESFGGEGGNSLLAGFEQFFTKKTAPASAKSPQGPDVNPKFQQRFDNRFADRAQQPDQGQPAGVTKPSVMSADFTADYQQFFTRRA